jgi:hypothetical protein
VVQLKRREELTRRIQGKLAKAKRCIYLDTLKASASSPLAPTIRPLLDLPPAAERPPRRSYWTDTGSGRFISRIESGVVGCCTEVKGGMLHSAQIEEGRSRAEHETRRYPLPVILVRYWRLPKAFRLGLIRPSGSSPTNVHATRMRPPSS